MNDEKIIKGLKNRKRSSLEKAIEKYSAYVNVVVYNIIGGKMSKEDKMCIRDRNRRIKGKQLC